VLHFTCHGFQGGILALEDGSGQVDELEKEELREMMQGFKGGSATGQTKLVFVSACFSEDIGEVFVQAGVPHVVAVRREAKVADLVAHEFSIEFHKHLFLGESVQEAFLHAEECIQNMPQHSKERRERQKEKFLLLPRDANHDFPLFPSWESGILEDISKPIPFHSYPPKTKPIFGRRISLQKVVKGCTAPFQEDDFKLRKSLSANSSLSTASSDSRNNTTHREGIPKFGLRWMTLHGSEGIGKSFIAISACDYVCKRRQCGAVCYVPLKGIGSNQTIRRSLVDQCRLHAHLDCGVRNAATEKTLCSALNALANSTNGRILLLLDGVEQLETSNENSWLQVNLFISNILENTQRVIVVCTKRGDPITKNLDALVSEPEFAVKIGPLTDRHAAKLLKHEARHYKFKGEDVIGQSSSWEKLTVDQRLDKIARTVLVRECAGHPLILEQVAERLRGGEGWEGAIELARRLARESFSPETPRSVGMAMPSQFLPMLDPGPRHHRDDTYSALGKSSEVVVDDVAAQLCACGDSELKWSVLRNHTEKLVDEEFYSRNEIGRRFEKRDFERMRSVFERSPCNSLETIQNAASKFLRWLRSMFSILIENASLWNSRVIYGLVSRDDVEEFLKVSPKGTFIIRVSESSIGKLASAYQSGGSAGVVHSLITPVAMGRVSVLYNKEGDEQFSSLGDFIASCEVFKFVFPNTPKLDAIQM